MVSAAVLLVIFIIVLTGIIAYNEKERGNDRRFLVVVAIGAAMSAIICVSVAFLFIKFFG